MSKIKITIAYFAILQEQSGCPEEVIDTSLDQAEDLYEFLKEKYDFTLPYRSIRIANKDTFLPSKYEIKDGDFIALIPPVAGG